MTEVQRLDRLEELFFAALELPDGQRSAFLRRACGDDAALRAAVERLLRADQTPGGPIEDASWRSAGLDAAGLDQALFQHAEEDSGVEAGAIVGGYRLVERIGAGGMGTVWRARRADDAFERTVAVKLIRGGMDSSQALHRFRLERQVLARLEHPHIARLYDGATTEDGRPYLVMEYVDGVPIDRYCREQHLDVDQILRLVCSVCDAVQFAHTQLVLHRDIKPANVLVTAGPTVKLLDFGIAKLLADDGAALTVTLDHAARTPRYASPEQVRGERLSTASDVYSLGVLVYELLTGRSPYRADCPTRYELEHAVLTEIPPPPSAVLARPAAGETAPRHHRARRIPRDLDFIVARALAKTPEERYASAEQFGQDIRRHLEGLPLRSRGPGPLGRLLRVMRRHRRGVLTATVAAGVALVIGAAAVSYWFMTPHWAREQVRAARQAFLSPELANAIWVLTFNNERRMLTDDRAPACPTDVAETALRAYDAALGFDSQLADVRIERDTVWLAAALSARPHQPPDIPPALARAAPLASAYATAWAHDGRPPELSDTELDSAAATDLRSLGLLAVLCGETRDCMRAWSRLGEFQADPLVEALLGILFLASDEPQRAYPRLLSAYREHPELGFLCTYLADAAIAVGDVSFGGLLLERAATLPHADPLEAHRRVRLRYYLATGQDEAAAAVFAEEAIHDNPVLRKQYAQYLFDAGQPRRALALLVEVIGQFPALRTVPAPIMHAAVDLTQRWWAELPDLQRRTVLVAAFDESPDDADSLYRTLDCYRAAIQAIERVHTPQTRALQAGPPAADPLIQSGTHAELHSLIDRLDLDRASRWLRFRRYPPELRTWQLAAWLSPDARDQSLAVDEAFAEWERIQPVPPPAHLKLTPATRDEHSFGALVGLQHRTALVLSTGLAIYDGSAAGWERQDVTTPPDARIVDASLDANRILALAQEPDAGAAPKRLLLFERPTPGGAWHAAAEIPVPAEANGLREVGLCNDLAAIIGGDESSHRVSVLREEDGRWQVEHTAAAGAGDYLPHLALGPDTLVLASAHGGPNELEQANRLTIHRRTPDGRWDMELELSPPAVGAGAVWDALDIDPAGNAVVATALSLQSHQTAVLVLRRDDAGQWREEADLTTLIATARRSWLGRELAIHGGRVVLGECDFSANVRVFHVLERDAAGWRHVDAIGPFDAAHSDRIGQPALSDEWLIFGAPRHDAVDIDAGAVYLVDLRSLQTK